MVFGFFCFTVNAQDLQKEFEKFRSSHEQDFLKEVRRQDSIFAQQIIKNWRSISLNPPLEKEIEQPKPKVLPETIDTVRNLNYKIEPAPAKKLRSISPVQYEHLDYYPDEDLSISSDFYGQEYQIGFPTSFVVEKEVVFERSFVSDFWVEMSKRPYQKLMNDLLLVKDQLNIPGYGFYLLSQDFAEQLNVSEDLKPFYVWFLMLKAGYDTRIGFSKNNPVIILASDVRIYGKNYFTEGDKHYYIFGEHDDSVNSYGEVYGKELSGIDFLINEPLDFPLKPVQKQYKFSHDNEEFQWSIYYNQNVFELLENFPQTEISTYLNARGSFLLERSLGKLLKDQLQGKSESEQVAFLMSFVQKAFDYETDQLQFGREKVMYPEQIIHYSKSDCDDRTVMLSYLLRTFTDVKSIALLFPQHIALAVKLPMPTFGETVDYMGNRFTFCDPTFYNAPLGTVIPDADRSRMEVLSY